MGDAFNFFEINPWQILENDTGKNVAPTLVRWNVLPASAKFTWLIVSFISFISLLILHPNVLLFVESMVFNILLLQNCQFSHEFCPFFASCCRALFGECIHGYLHHVFLMEWPFYQYKMLLFVCFNSFFMQVCFVWHQYRHKLSFVLFASFQFQPICWFFLLHPYICWWKLLVNFHSSYYTLKLLNLFGSFLQLLFLYWHSVFGEISFSLFSLALWAYLRQSVQIQSHRLVNPMSRPPQEFVLIFFFSCNWDILLCFFACLVIFCWKLDILNTMVWSFWKSDSADSSGFLVVACSLLSLSVQWPFKRFSYNILFGVLSLKCHSLSGLS